VQLRANRCGAVAALMLAAALCGCANTDLFDQNERWFSRSLDVTGKSTGYTYSEMQESSSRNRTIAANDLVDANGACPPMPAAAPAPPLQSAAQGPIPIPTAPDAAPTLLGQGVALNMSECDVVYRAGAPSSVQLGKSPNGERSLVLTYDAGPRPGIYHFEGGRLVDMDRVEVAAPPPEPKVAKKKKPPKPPAQQLSAQ
jgi:hypothetical protein